MMIILFGPLWNVFDSDMSIKQAWESYPKIALITTRFPILVKIKTDTLFFTLSSTRLWKWKHILKFEYKKPSESMTDRDD